MLEPARSLTFEGEPRCRYCCAACWNKWTQSKALLEAEFRGCTLYCCFCSRVRIAEMAPALIVSELVKRLR